MVGPVRLILEIVHPALDIRRACIAVLLGVDPSLGAVEAVDALRLALPLLEEIAATDADAPDVAAEFGLREEAADWVWTRGAIGGADGEGREAVAVHVDGFHHGGEFVELFAVRGRGLVLGVGAVGEALWPGRAVLGRVFPVHVEFPIFGEGQRVDVLDFEAETGLLLVGAWRHADGCALVGDAGVVLGV